MIATDARPTFESFTSEFTTPSALQGPFRIVVDSRGQAHFIPPGACFAERLVVRPADSDAEPMDLFKILEGSSR
jgi:hypothetical protein